MGLSPPVVGGGNYTFDARMHGGDDDVVVREESMFAKEQKGDIRRTSLNLGRVQIREVRGNQ